MTFPHLAALKTKLKPYKPTLRDICLLGGLCLFGYGLYLVRPWIAYASCGVLLMAAGYFMPVKDSK